MGGSIDVRSKRMQGTCFDVTMQSQCKYKTIFNDDQNMDDEYTFVDKNKLLVNIEQVVPLKIT